MTARQPLGERFLYQKLSYFTLYYLVTKLFIRFLTIGRKSNWFFQRGWKF